MAQPGIFANGAAPRRMTSGEALTTNRSVGVSSEFALNADHKKAEVRTSFGATGLGTLAVLVAGLWALDRYVLDAPGLGG